MPTDLTGTPTSLGIGTYNTSVDAPSGLGFNAAMAQIDALIAARVLKPTGIVSGEVPVWNGTSWVRSSVTNVSPASLGSGAPSSANFLRGDGTWAPAASTTYRKVTAKQVVNTITETDLLNGEITIGAGVLGTSGILRLTVAGDWIQNSGITTDVPHFKLKLGATTIFDSGAVGGNIATSSTRYGWIFRATIANLGATNSQWSNLEGHMSHGGTSAATAGTFPTGEGRIYAPMFTTSGLAASVLFEAGNSSAVDTTVANALVFSTILPTNSATLDVTLRGALVEVV